MELETCSKKKQTKREFLASTPLIPSLELRKRSWGTERKEKKKKKKKNKQKKKKKKNKKKPQGHRVAGGASERKRYSPFKGGE